MPIPRPVKRGEIYWVDWGGVVGKHPALIIQSNIGNETANSTIVAYITDANKPDLALIVHFNSNESSLSEAGAVDLGRIMWLPKVKLGDRGGFLASNKMLEVNEAIKASLGLD